MDENNTLWLYRYQNKGNARRLRGTVLIELVFVSDQKTAWMPNEKDRFYRVYQNALEGLRKQAVAAGVPLSFATVVGGFSYQGTVSSDCTVSNTGGQIWRQYLRKQGFADAQDFVRSRKSSNGADEVALVLVMEQGFRAFSSPNNDLEYCALCQNDNEHAIAHELLHLFGAADLYYPYHVYGQTMAYFPNTVMCTYEGMEVDPLTQYLIGWRTEPTAKAKEFMHKVRDCTEARYRQANLLEIYRNQENLLLSSVQSYTSLEQLRVEALRGENWAEFLLGLCCRDGIGMGQDLAKAEEYFARSGRTGLVIAAAAHAQLLLYRGIRTEQDRENLWLLLIYNSYDHLKLNSLRVACQLAGIGCKADMDQAVQAALSQYQNPDWYLQHTQRSAKLYQIAEKYCSQIPQLSAAVRKLRRDYERMLEGDPDLYYMIARLLEEGKYVQKDLSGALKLYQQSARGGNEPACRALARCCRQGVGTVYDPAAARKWESQAALCRSENPLDAFCHILRNRW